MHPFFNTRQFLALLALLIGLTALAIDVVLPAFPEMTQQFQLAVEEENQIQMVVFVFMLGLSITQLLFGLLADIFGRKPVLAVGLTIYLGATIWAIFASDLQTLLIARFLQGVGLGAPRVLSMVIVRDVASGREMARMMSIVMMIFMIIPILAPMVGQAILLVGNWHDIFIFLSMIGIVALAWSMTALPETLAASERRAFGITTVLTAIKTCLSDKTTLIYLFVLGLLFSQLMSYIGQFEQIFQRDVYGVGESFVFIFALIASAMIASAVVNSKFVVRKGLQRMIICALLIMCVADTLLLTLTHLYNGKPPLIAVIVLLMLHFFSYSMLMPNFNSLVMLPYRHIAGTAAALISSLMTLIGVGLAHLISATLNATLYPLSIAFFSVSVCVLVISLMIFKGKNIDA